MCGRRHRSRAVISAANSVEVAERLGSCSTIARIARFSGCSTISAPKCPPRLPGRRAGLTCCSAVAKVADVGRHLISGRAI